MGQDQQGAGEDSGQELKTVNLAPLLGGNKAFDRWADLSGQAPGAGASLLASAFFLGLAASESRMMEGGMPGRSGSFSSQAR